MLITIFRNKIITITDNCRYLTFSSLHLHLLLLQTPYCLLCADVTAALVTGDITPVSLIADLLTIPCLC